MRLPACHAAIVTPVILSVVTAMLLTAGAAGAATDAELAAHWAPVIFQDVDADADGRRDFITSYDFDGNEDLTDNWENTTIKDGEVYRHPLPAVVYYAVVESETHYYISYFFYHPQDWQFYEDAGVAGDPGAHAATTQQLEHESDLEGATMVVLKSPLPFGTFRAMFTEAHFDIYYFADDPTVVVPNRTELPQAECASGSLDHRDGLFGDPNGHCPQSESATAYTYGPEGRRAVFIEARGHGVGQIARALQQTSDGETVSFGGTLYNFWGIGLDGVIYWPGAVAAEPDSANDRDVTYELRPFETTLWPLRHSDQLFQEFTTITTYRGVSLTGVGRLVRAAGQPAGANPPWSWGSLAVCPSSLADCGDVLPGDPFLDPAQTVAEHLVFPDEALSGFLVYERNIYLLGDNAIDVTAPGDGDSVRVGDVTFVTWDTTAPPDTSTGLAAQLSIELSRNGGTTWETIAPSVSRVAGSWPWNVSGPATDRAVVRLTAFSAAGGFLPLRATSGTVTIVPDAPQVLGVAPTVFSGLVTIRYFLPEELSVDAAIFDPGGRRVRRLVDGVQVGGELSVGWDRRDDDGDLVAPGHYVFHLRAGGAEAVAELVALPAGGSPWEAAVDVSLDLDRVIGDAVAGTGRADAGDLVAGTAAPQLSVAPNPGGARSLTIRYALAVASPVRVRIFDLHGRHVRTLVDAPRAAGDHAILWDTQDAAGVPVPAGIYLCRVDAGMRAASRKLIVLR